MNRFRNLGLMLVAALLVNTTFAQEKTVTVGGVLKDGKGGMAMVTIKDVNQSNGVIHAIDHVVMPK